MSGWHMGLRDEGRLTMTNNRLLDTLPICISTFPPIGQSPKSSQV